MNHLKYPIIFVVLFLSLQITKAQVTLASIFTDNLVLQQQSKSPIWGWGPAGNSISVTTSWNQKKQTAKADAQGKWKFFIETPSAGGPYTITISDGKPITLKNVLIGEVWLCAGQSNME